MNIPQDQLSEQRILSAMLTSEDACHNTGSLKKHHFYSERNAKIYETCQDLIQAGERVDLVSVSNRLQTSDYDTYLVELTNVYSSVATMHVSVNEVIDTFRRRKLLELAQKTSTEIQDGSGETGEIIEAFSSEVMSITDDIEVDKSSIGDLIEDYKQWLRDNHAKIEASDGGIIGLSTGVSGLDELTDGMQDGAFWVIGAMTSGGKSAMMLNMANSVLEAGKKASVYSLEMSKNGIINRILSIRHKWDASLIKRLGVDKSELTAATAKLATQGLKIYDSSLS